MSQVATASPARSLEELFQRVTFAPSPEQLEAITSIDGPQVIIAGPGSGKTQVLVLRCLNLILFHHVDPSEILICTYTEKAAASLQDRIRRGIRAAGAENLVDLSELWVGTIHSMCEEIINEYLDESGLAKGYEVLDDLTQQLFLHEHFYDVLHRPGPLANSHWKAIEKATVYFAKITEDLVDAAKMREKGDEKAQSIARKYERYVKALKDSNRVDFAQLQSIVLDLLDKPVVGPELESKFKFIMIDEYQDTNFIQEQLFLRLSKKTQNICVVGDEDQSLYRFRGATVLNFLRFPDKFRAVKKVKLERNYRSTPQIISLINKFIGEPDWTDNRGKDFRYEKTIRQVRPTYANGMASVYRVSNNSATRVAQLIKQLISGGAVEDLNQIAILLRSVARDGPPFFEALQRERIEYYAPRARAYFDRQEIMGIIGTLVYFTDLMKKGQSWNSDLWEFYRDCATWIEQQASLELKKHLERTKNELAQLQGNLKKGIVDLFYEILAFKPFSNWKEDPVAARNLAIFSDLLTKFQDYYKHPVILSGNIDVMRNRLFNSFLYAMRENGLDEYEDPRDIFPSGYVQVMTIHQCKGLEFPIVVVGSLNKRPRAETVIDRELEPFSRKKEFEPYSSMGIFDQYRLFYVAFSRAIDLLVLACDVDPHATLQNAFNQAAELRQADIERMKQLKFVKREFLPPKEEFSITGHIHFYETCPRQYKYYKEYGFSGSRSAGESFGTLVHYTIEDIHNHFLKKKPGSLDMAAIAQYFSRNLRTVTRGGVHPLAGVFQDMAWDQVINYYKNNQDKFGKLIQAEVPILVERPDYVMSGIIDLIRGEKGELELLDFKADKLEDMTEDRKEFYKFQLAVYAKMIESKFGERPQKTYIYLTAEEDPRRALAPISIENVEANAAEKSFDEKAHKILKKDFTVRKAPPRDVCRNCDFRLGCDDRKLFYPDMRA